MTITMQELLALLGEKDVLIYQLQGQVAALQTEVAKLTPAEAKESDRDHSGT